MSIYQDAAGGWIWFDGQQKHHYATEQEAAMAARDSAIQTYEAQYRAIRTQARVLIGMIREIELTRLSNPEIAQLVAATDPGAIVGDSTLTKEAAETALGLLASFQAWSMTPLADGSPATPISAVYRED
jgi:hypothetical protein